MKRELKLGQQFESYRGEILTIIGFDEDGDPYFRSNVSNTAYVETENGIPFSAKYVKKLKCLNE